MKMEEVLLKPRIMFLLILLVLSFFQLKPWSGLNVEWGFDIQGGARIILKPVNQSISLEDITLVIQNRLNIYGLRDIRVRGASDLQNKFVVVEAAGLSKEDIEKLLASEGRFEGKIGNFTVFRGGDVKVDKARIRLYYDRATGMYRYEIPILLSPEAAKRFAEATKNLMPVGFNGTYLEKKFDFYIDGQLIESLNIASDLRGREVPSAAITGGAKTYDEAKTNVKRMTAILMTGAIPTKMEIVSIQNVSPKLGKEFLKSTAFAGLAAALLVSFVIFIRYRNPSVIAAILFTAFSEMILTLAVASLINWQLDLSAIAGIIITLGTGIDQQIIITDEFLYGYSKKREKEAMFVILASFGTIVAAMFPLMFIGVGAVRGFAVTTIIGIAIGYFITRPAYAQIAELLFK